ncbi:MAG: hypothetical protein H6861_07395 [Rhodospirillales bacterium]|nr:hypothetical protein [Rhodospirillales bacterium]
MSAAAATQLYMPTPPLRDHWQRAGAVAERAKTALYSRARKITDSKLTRTFAKAAMGAGCIMAFKSAAVGLAGSFGASAALGGATAGTFITGYQAIKDYRAQDKQRPQGIWNIVKDFFCFLGENKWKYTGKLLKNSGAAALGGTALLEFLEMFAPLANAGEIDDLQTPERLANNYQQSSEPEITTPPPAEATVTEEILATETTEPQTAVTQAEPPETAAAPTLTPLDKLSQLNHDEFSGRAAKTLSYAEKGHDWAVKEMAIHLLRENNGSPLNRELAVELLQIAEHSDNPKIADQASRDLDIIRERWPEAFVQEEITIAETPALEPETAATVIKSPPPEAPVSEEQIIAQPLSPLERLAALNPQDFNERGQYVLQFAEKGHGWALNEMASSLLYEGNGSPQNRKLAVELYKLAQESGNANAIEHATKDLAAIERLWGVNTIMSETQIAEQTPPQDTKTALHCIARPSFTSLELQCTMNTDMVIAGDTIKMSLPQADITAFPKLPDKLLAAFSNTAGADTLPETAFSSPQPCEDIKIDPTHQNLLSFRCEFEGANLYTSGTYSIGDFALSVNPTPQTIASAPTASPRLGAL